MSLDITLTAVQAKHLDTIHWLYSGARGAGRTRLLVIGAVTKAMADEGQWVEIILQDRHRFGGHEALAVASKVISEMDKAHRLAFNFNRDRCAIKFVGVKDEITRKKE